MANKTKIEWTEFNWNFLRGCSRVSEGCRNCYAETVAHRFGGEGQPYEGLTVLGNDGKPRWNGKVTFHEDVLVKPLRWTKPRKIFVNSMSDLFHESVSFDVIDKAFAVMALTPQHTYQILTKRPKRMREYLTAKNLGGVIDGYILDIQGKSIPFGDSAEKPLTPLSNVWLGFSAENQETFNERYQCMEELAQMDWLIWCSLEPLLGSIDLQECRCPIHGRDEILQDDKTNEEFCNECAMDGGGGDLPCYDTLEWLSWVVVGGESGHGARPMHPDWVRNLRNECVSANVPFFFKQWGELSPQWVYENVRAWANTTSIIPGIAVDQTGKVLVKGTDYEHAKYPVYVLQRFGKKQAGRLLDGVEWNEYPEVKR